MKINVKLLRKIKRHILAKPRCFVMRTFVIREKDSVSDNFVTDGGQTVRFETCGTAACIAGWAVLLSDGMDADLHGVRYRATQLLGLEDGFDEDRIFEWTHWPSEFYKSYARAKTQTARAKIAGKFIDHFIATKGK